MLSAGLTQLAMAVLRSLTAVLSKNENSSIYLMDFRVRVISGSIPTGGPATVRSFSGTSVRDLLKNITDIGFVGFTGGVEGKTVQHHSRITSLLSSEVRSNGAKGQAMNQSRGSKKPLDPITAFFRAKDRWTVHPSTCSLVFPKVGDKPYVGEKENIRKGSRGCWNGLLGLSGQDGHRKRP